MKVTKNIDIYLTNKRPVKVIDVVQYDTGVQLAFTVKDFEIPSGATATLYVQKPSGKFVYQQKNITIANNTITVDLENQALTEYGKTPYQVTVSSGSDTITTFTGLMMVERSLKDAGATESRTVIKAFDEVTASKIAELQANAETVVNAVIATIPDDYTELTAKVNESANAIKGKLSGAVVSADDVSPVEHLMKVNVHGKNLLKNTTVTQTIDGVTFTANSDGSVTANGTASADYPVRYNLGEVVLDAGNYLISGQSEGVAASFVMYSDQDGNNHQQHSGKDAELTLTKTTKINVYFVVMESRTVSNVTVYPMIRLASVLESDYEPYVDPSTVKVTRCGKNILKNTAVSQTTNGITYTVNENGSVICSGTAEEYVFLTIRLKLKAGKYILNGCPQGGSDATYSNIFCEDSVKYVYKFDTGKGVEFELAEEKECEIYLCRISKGETVSNLKFYPMIRHASIENGIFEPYNGTEYIPTSDGVVDGVISLSPNMTILTDTEGVIVECEYNKDTNKVVQKFADALGITI